MKKLVNRKSALWTAIALSVTAGAALSSAAYADSSSVTIYGIVDAGVVSVSNQAVAAGGTGRDTALNTGGMSPSIFGFKGSEDLGNGLKANFNLEGHMFTTTGAGDQWGGDRDGSAHG